MNAQPTPDAILQLGFAFWSAKTLLTAVELEVFTVLAEEPQTERQLVRRLQLHGRGAQDFLDALVALGMLEREGEHYRNTPATLLYLDKNKPTYMGGILEMANARLYGFWGHLTEALRTGKPQNEIREGFDLFESIYPDPDKLKLFLKAMTGVSFGTARAIAQKFPWANYKTFIDIGCAEGALPVAVAQAHPHVSGGGFDLPAVEPIFNAYVAQHGLAHRLRFHPGSFFTDPLPQADVLVMGHILHDWDLQEKRQLIAKVYEALPQGGAFIVYEALIDDERRQNAFGLLMSLNMLIETNGGFDYTGADCCGWMREAGFRETRVEHLLGPDSMVIGVK